jgi:dimeric dUTPase (all-alpha-NTP-PPase superfamily)
MDLFSTLHKMTDNINTKIKGNLDFDEIMTSEVNGAIDFKLWMETVELQKKFNNRVASDWMTNPQKYDYWMAVLDETVEVLNSKHWKWWKDSEKQGEVDWDNVVTELIDIFHFLLSIAMQQETHHILFSQMLNMEINKETITNFQDSDFFKDFWDEFLMPVQMKMLPVAAVRWVDFWYRSGGDAETLFKEYRIKAALNNIRQEFGYGKTNSYEKMWPDSETGLYVEDNVIARKLADNLELNDTMLEELTKLLKDYYLNNIAI